MAQTQKPATISLSWDKRPPEQTASALYSYALALETYTAARRIRNTVLYRLCTGEDPPVQFGLWMASKAASGIGALGANYTKPYSNIMANGMSVLENRIGTTVPFVQISPSNVSFEVRSACKDVTDFVDAVFAANRYAEISRLCFRDRYIWGTCFVKVSASSDNQSIVIERVLPDEILIDERAAGLAPPSKMIQHRPMLRSNVWALYGGKGDARIDAAIRMAPPAFGGGGVLADDFIYLLEGWSLPGEAGEDEEPEPGRHVLALQNCLLVDELWTRKRFPFAVARWQPPTMGYFVPGGAFQISPYQMEVNYLDEHIRANIRTAHGIWLTAAGSGITSQTFGIRPGALVTYTGQKPEHVVPQANGAELYNYRKQKENDGYASIGITSQQVAGQKQAGVTAGVAIRLMVDFEDSRNKSHTISSETLCSDVAELVIDVADEIRPKVQTTGVGNHELKWGVIADAIKRNQYTVEPFPVNSIVGTPIEKQQQIAELYADGKIDKRAAFKLQQLPDLSSFASLFTASDDLVEATLDEIVRTGKFISPEPTYESLPQALKDAAARFNLEKRLKSPPKVLKALRLFMSVLADMIAHPDGQMLQPEPAPAPALPSAPGQAPAGPPPQAAPSMAPPVQMAA